ncbi:hypothetical protein [Actinomadura rudentiformis]|uniref:Uncharacterized protein n=1 Tax=Actinomadura rudentiformis TaxID=359158 RepID=A0A6H9YKD7_9ACTN|nr:hypothetical protein [Actinomadura rudentiformis]KAB2346058.1 hypothetical protein F8566_25470 [Actinomadura rudentiformis]
MQVVSVVLRLCSWRRAPGMRRRTVPWATVLQDAGNAVIGGAPATLGLGDGDAGFSEGVSEGVGGPEVSVPPPPVGAGAGDCPAFSRSSPPGTTTNTTAAAIAKDTTAVTTAATRGRRARAGGSGAE